MPASTTVAIQLRVTGPDGLSKDVTLGQDNAIVGSGPSATIRLLDPKVSAVHFLLKVGKAGELTVLDLGSEAGTRVRGEVIREPVSLVSGDLIQVGGSSVRVKFGPEDDDGTEVVLLPDAVPSPKPSARMSSSRLGEVMSATAEEETVAAHTKGSLQTVRSSAAKPLSSFQGSVDQKNAFALGPNGNRLLNEELSVDEEPTERNRRLEVALLWGDTVIDVRSFDPGRTVKIGPTPGADFRVYDESGLGSFDLVANNAVKVPPSGSIVVYSDGRETRQSGQEVPLGLRDRALVSLETTHLIIRWVRPATRSKTGVFDSIDFYFTKVLSVAFLAHLVLLIGFWITPLNNDLLSEDLFKNPSALVKTLIKAPEKKKKFDLSGVKEGAKAKDKEGKFGKKEAKKPEAAPSKKGAPIVDAKKREEDRKKIMNSGLLMGLHGPQGAVSNVFGPGGLGTGLNNALGGLQGNAGMGDAHGVGGLGSRGAGPGGGGTALGIGGLGTKGTGRGRGGMGDIDLGGKGKGDTKIMVGKTVVVGSLSKDVIAAIIRKHQNEIKYCYEVELNKHPDLYGKVSVAFTIDGTGGVSDANVNETTMNNNNVENCMTTKIRRWKFPEPKGGGQVFVTYPWIFKASGSEE